MTVADYLDKKNKNNNFDSLSLNKNENIELFNLFKLSLKNIYFDNYLNRKKYINLLNNDNILEDITIYFEDDAILKNSNIKTDYEDIFKLCFIENKNCVLCRNEEFYHMIENKNKYSNNRNIFTLIRNVEYLGKLLNKDNILEFSFKRIQIPDKILMELTL